MRYLTDSIYEKIAVYVASLAESARFYSGGAPTDIPVHKAIAAGSKVEVWLRIPAGVSQVDKVQVFDTDGDLMLERLTLLTKPVSRNLYTKFKFEIAESIATTEPLE